MGYLNSIRVGPDKSPCAPLAGRGTGGRDSPLKARTANGSKVTRLPIRGSDGSWPERSRFRTVDLLRFRKYATSAMLQLRSSVSGNCGLSFFMVGAPLHGRWGYFWFSSTPNGLKTVQQVKQVT
jgi:hypothetical protein